MKILYLAHRLPYPPNKGDKLRSYHELEFLARRHDVWCACFVDDPADLRHVAGLRSLCHDVKAIRLFRSVATPKALWNLARGGTITEGYYAHLAMVRTLRRWDREVGFDALLVFSSGMAPYARHIAAPRRVIDFCDLDSQKWLAYAHQARGPKSLLYGVEGRRLARRERQWLAAFDRTVLITPAEAADLRDPTLRRKVVIVGNGVEVPDLPSGPAVPEAPVVGFVGAMDYPPNIDAVRWFVEAVWPLVLGQVPGARFEIVGRRPAREVRALSRVPGVSVLGEVGDVSSAVRRFRVSVAPMRMARGLQNKVLEAMAHARPVVLTSAAATGMNATDGEHFLVADDAPRFAACVASLLADAGHCEQLGMAARSYVRERHCWEREMAKIESCLESDAAAEERSAGARQEVGAPL